jgi:putative SOS response-associated peptidase YedK
MPVILTPSQLDLWLSVDELPSEVAMSVLRPYDPAKMRANPASARVNNARYDHADALVPDAISQTTLDLF